MNLEIQPMSKAMGFHSLQKSWGKILYGQKRPDITNSQQKMPSKLPQKGWYKGKAKASCELAGNKIAEKINKSFIRNWWPVE